MATILNQQRTGHQNRVIPPPPKTGVQYVCQYEYIEGDYEIYGTCKASTTGTGETSLYVLSKNKPGINITRSFPALKLGEKTLLMKVHITADGSIQRIN